METIAIVYNLQEALLLQSVLRGHGIFAEIPDEYTVQADWLYTVAIGGIRVQVPQAYAKQALALLNDFQRPQ